MTSSELHPRQRSRIVGTTRSVANHKGYEVYEALIPLTCEGCDCTIEPGEHFTRRLMPGGGRRRWEFCGDCMDAVVA